MAAITKTCPKCGGPLTAPSGDAAKLACKPCGLRFGVRPKKVVPASAPAGSRPPRNEFADLMDATAAPPKAASASPARPRPAPAGDPRLRLALLVGAGLAFVFLGMLGTIVVAVILWARSAAQAAAVAAAAVNTPTAPAVADTEYHPISTPAPPTEDPPPTPATKKPTPPKDDLPPIPPTPPVIPPPNLKPAPDPAPMPVPMPAPEVKPAGGPINQAIDKAVAFLKKAATRGPEGPSSVEEIGVDGKGNQVGIKGLIGLALLESDVPADDPAVVAATTVVRDGAPTCASTYEIAIAIWCLDRLGDPKDEDHIRELAARLIAGQYLDGGKWGYTCPQGGAAGSTTGGGGDLSLTQFAVLGLWVARRHHVPVDRSLLLAEAGVRAGQSADGGWSYDGVLGDMGTSDAMTCSGMMELAIGRGVSHSENAKTVAADPQFEKGLIYLADLFTRGVNKQKVMGAQRPARFLKRGKSQSHRPLQDDIYCLWSLERLCMVCDLKTVAGHDWYAWGADLLVGYQNDDGHWTGSLQSPVDTCLAVLFLKRVNVAKDLTAQLKFVAPIKDLSADKLKFISSGESPSPGLTQPKSPGETQPSPGEAPPVKAPGDAPPAATPDAPKP